MKYSLLTMDVIEGLRTLPSESVQVCVTSPPYWNLRDYGVPGQIGLESTLSEYVDKMVEVFAEVRRVLRSDGTLWLNIGDSYASGEVGRHDSVQGREIEGKRVTAKATERQQSKSVSGLAPKNLCMVPARVALALQADGWYLRSEIIWAKRAPMPESVTDRPTSAHEKIFLLSKSAKYYYDADAVREQIADSTADRDRYTRISVGKYEHVTNGNTTGDGVGRYTAGLVSHEQNRHPAGRNLRNVWTLSPEPCADAHFATFPSIIPKRAILAGTSERGCCPNCGAGWVRVVEVTKGDMEAFNRPKHLQGKSSTLGLSGNGSKEWAERGSKREEVGWQPSCDCSPEDGTYWCPTCDVFSDSAALVSGCPDCGETMIPAPYTPIPCTVLDPFAGSGTSLAVAVSIGRYAVGIEINPDYAWLAEKRIAPYAAQELLAL